MNKNKTVFLAAGAIIGLVGLLRLNIIVIGLAAILIALAHFTQKEEE